MDVEEKNLSLKISKFSEMPDRVSSEKVIVRGLLWSLLAYRVQQEQGTYLGVFLRCDGPTIEKSDNWSVQASVVFNLCPRLPHSRATVKRISHTFYKKDNVFGFLRFRSWNDIISPENGFIKDDTVVITACLRAQVPEVNNEVDLSSNLIVDEEAGNEASQSPERDETMQDESANASPPVDSNEEVIKKRKYDERNNSYDNLNRNNTSTSDKGLEDRTDLIKEVQVLRESLKELEKKCNDKNKRLIELFEENRELRMKLDEKTKAKDALKAIELLAKIS